MAQGIISITSANVKDYTAKAWQEAKPVAESLPKPKRGAVARFFPTDDCDILIKVIMDEYSQKLRFSKPESSALHESLNFKTGGYVVFPGKTATGQTSTIMIPLHVIGEVTIGVTTVDTDHYYNILTECDVEVSEGGRLVALVVSDIE